MAITAPVTESTFTHRLSITNAVYFTFHNLIRVHQGSPVSAIRPSNSTELLDDHSELEPPDPIPNSEVKRLSADGSVGSPHVRVGHRQAPNTKPRVLSAQGFFIYSVSLCFYSM